MTKLRFLLLIVLFAVAGYLWVKGPAGLQLPKVAEVAKVSDGTSPQPSPNLGDGGARGEIAKERTVLVHYFSQEGLAACSTETVTRVVEPDSKYGHQAAGALVAQTMALPLEQREQYASALAPGTRLLSMKISPEGVAAADYNSALNAELNDCNKAQRRAQIERTLREFPEVKQVVITVQSEKWE